MLLPKNQHDTKDSSKRGKKGQKKSAKLQDIQKTINKMTILSLSLSIINVNGSNSPTKSQRLAGWIQKTRYNYILPTLDSLQI